MQKTQNQTGIAVGGKARSLVDAKTHRRMLYYMMLTRELEDRIERKLYRQGKILAEFMSAAGRRPSAWVLVFSLVPTTSYARHIATWPPS
jgi:TPP-dependent pyruvate/acetoin dehydrogenase alpha subunit